MEHRGFARAVGTDQANQRSRGYLEAYVTERDDTAEANYHVVDV
jgi:hypothetical protein